MRVAVTHELVAQLERRRPGDVCKEELGDFRVDGFVKRRVSQQARLGGWPLGLRVRPKEHHAEMVPAAKEGGNVAR